MKRLKTFLVASLAAGGCIDTEGAGELAASEQAIVGAFMDYYESNEGGDDPYGVPLHPDRTCFLSTVAGKLGAGTLWDYSSQLVHNGMTRVTVGAGNYINDDEQVLYARGGYYLNQVNAPVWAGNEVAGRVHCVDYPVSANEYIGGSSYPIEGAFSEHVIIAYGKRQCFLDALVGGDGSWISTSTSVRVQKRHAGMFTHWFLEGNLPHGGNGIWPSVGAVCMDFPSTSTIVGPGHADYEPVTAPPLGVTVRTLVDGPHSWLDSWVCGITGIDGAFHNNSHDDGIKLLDPLETGNGSWQLRVTNGKTAHWACVK